MFTHSTLSTINEVEEFRMAGKKRKIRDSITNTPAPQPPQPKDTSTIERDGSASDDRGDVTARLESTLRKQFFRYRVVDEAHARLSAASTDLWEIVSRQIVNIKSKHSATDKPMQQTNDASQRKAHSNGLNDAGEASLLDGDVATRLAEAIQRQKRDLEMMGLAQSTLNGGMIQAIMLLSEKIDRNRGPTTPNTSEMDKSIMAGQVHDAENPIKKPDKVAGFRESYIREHIAAIHSDWIAHVDYPRIVDCIKEVRYHYEDENVVADDDNKQVAYCRLLIQLQMRIPPSLYLAEAVRVMSKNHTFNDKTRRRLKFWKLDPSKVCLPDLRSK